MQIKVGVSFFFPEGSFLDADMGDAPSFSWRSIMEAHPVLQARVLWKVSSGTSINLWKDNWIPNIAASSLIKPVGCPLECVADLINP